MAGPLKRYTVNVNGYETVMSLNEEDAKRLGAQPVEDTSTETKTRKIANKARTPQNKAAE